MSAEAGRRALLVVDAPGARSKDVSKAIAALQAGGLTLLRRDTQRSRMAELITAMKNQVDCVIVAGSDAMLSAGAIALRDTGLPLGILPLGSTDLATLLGIPMDLEQAAAVILAGVTRGVRLGSVNGRPFFTAASVGLPIEAARHLGRTARRPLGAIRYRWAAFRAIMQTRRFSAIIRCGAIVHRVRTVQVTIGNGRLFSGGMDDSVVQPADQGGLAVYSLEPTRRWGLLFMAGVFTAAPGETIAEARYTHSPVVEVVTRLPQPISADGEVVTVTPARFSLLPQMVTVYVPAGVPEPIQVPAPAEAPNPPIGSAAQQHED